VTDFNLSCGASRFNRERGEGNVSRYISRDYRIRLLFECTHLSRCTTDMFYTPLKRESSSYGESLYARSIIFTHSREKPVRRSRFNNRNCPAKHAREINKALLRKGDLFPFARDAWWNFHVEFSLWSELSLSSIYLFDQLRVSLILTMYSNMTTKNTEIQYAIKNC